MTNFIFNKKKCILIDPGINFLGQLKGFNFPGHFPFGLLSIASFMQKNSIPVKVLALDYYFPMTKEMMPREKLLKDIEQILRREIKDNSPAAIGISVTYTPQCTLALQLVDLIKKIEPNIITVLGGSHVTFLDEKTFWECPSLDVIVRGEGEWTMAELVSSILRKKNLETVLGISFRKNNQIIRAPNRTFGDLSKLPVINFALIPESFYKDRQINIALSRGCMYACKFCAERIFWGGQVRLTPIEKIVKEAGILFKKYKISFLSFEDSMVTIISEYFNQLSDGLMKIENRRLGHMVTRVDAVNQEGLLAVKRTGFQMLIYGIESGSEKVLKAMNKRIMPDQVRKALTLTKEAGLIIGGFWLIGHPGDNEEEACKSLSFMERLYADGILDISTIARFIPYPGSDFFNNPKKYGLKIFHYRWEEWRRYQNRGVCELDDFSDAQIAAAHGRAFQKSMEWKLYNSLNKRDSFLARIYTQWGAGS